MLGIDPVGSWEKLRSVVASHGKSALEALECIRDIHMGSGLRLQSLPTDLLEELTEMLNTCFPAEQDQELEEGASFGTNTLVLLLGRWHSLPAHPIPNPLQIQP